MSSERFTPQLRLSRRRLITAAAGAALGRNVLPARADTDPHVASYEAFLEESFTALQSPEGRFERSYDLGAFADIIYGYVLGIINEQDELTIDFSRDDFSFTASGNTLLAAGQLEAERPAAFLRVSGEAQFAVEFTSSPEGRLSINYDDMVIDGSGALAVFDIEGIVRDSVGDDVNAFFVEHMNKIYKEKYGEDDLLAGARIGIDGQRISITLTREEA